MWFISLPFAFIGFIASSFKQMKILPLKENNEALRNKNEKLVSEAEQLSNKILRIEKINNFNLSDTEADSHKKKQVKLNQELMALEKEYARLKPLYKKKLDQEEEEERKRRRRNSSSSSGGFYGGGSSGGFGGGGWSGGGGGFSGGGASGGW